MDKKADAVNPQKEKQQFRPPVVVVLGHVDHGKTSILDYIRQTKIAEKESGGITQHIGAYQVSHNNKLITFIDTPGHEAFSAMRSRGAQVADLAILVVAADEGIKPQTKEAISHIKKAGLSMIVALNKIDKKDVQPEKVKADLAKEEIYVESFGGKVPSVEVSAKTGQGINDLLDLILLIAEVEGLGKIELAAFASGVIVESKLDARRGPSATLLIKNGLLKIRDIVAAESTFGTVRIMEDFRLKSLTEAGPSSPVLMIGFEQVPGVGEKWQVYQDIDTARQIVAETLIKEKNKKEPVEFIEIDPNKKILNVIIKADVIGSLEAIRESLMNIPQDEVTLRIIKAEVGDINETDIKSANSSNAQIFGFRIKMPPSLAVMADNLKVNVFLYDIIYDFIQAVREEAIFLLSPKIVRQELGRGKLIAYFKQTGNRQIAGFRVLDGKVERGCLVDVLRNSEKVGNGKIVQLQKNKLEIKEGSKDEECAMLFEGEIKLEIGDSLEFYKEEKKKRESI